jgi:hypothetical protein
MIKTRKVKDVKHIERMERNWICVGFWWERQKGMDH